MSENKISKIVVYKTSPNLVKEIRMKNSEYANIITPSIFRYGLETFAKDLVPGHSWYTDKYDYEDLDKLPYLSNDFAVLEYLFEVFNLFHPDDYLLPSLSVNDIVQLNEKYYGCVSMGWIDVTDIITKERKR